MWGTIAMPTPLNSGTTGLNQPLPTISTYGSTTSGSDAQRKRDADLAGVPERNRWMIPARPTDAGDVPAPVVAPGTVSNDGRANALDTTPLVGNRTLTLAGINHRLDEIHEQQATTEKKIAEYQRTIDDKQGNSNFVDVATKVGMPLLGAIDGVANLLGKDFNPAGDAANAVQHTKDDYNALVEQRGQLEKDEAALTTQRDEQRDARALNFLTNVAHLTSMDDETTRTLDGRGSVNLEIAGSDNDTADARFDPSTNTIEVPRKTINEIGVTLDDLAKRGIVDDNGKILKPQQFDASKIGDQAIAMAATIGVHERTHGLQLENGTYAAVEATGADVSQGVPALEYQAYRDQELAELQAGKQKAGFLTVNSDGSLLPRAQAEANILAFQDGQPLPSPGVDLDAPGRHAPGSDAPGRHAPGSDAPGRHAPGQNAL